MKLEVFYDFACPYCYIGLIYLKEVLTNYSQIEILWRPCEAHPEPEERMVIDQSGPKWWQNLKPVAEKNGIVLKIPYNPVPHSNLAMEGIFFLMEQGEDVERYNRNIFKAVFEDSLNIEDLDVLVLCLEGLNIDEKSFRRVLNNRIYKEVQKDFNTYAFSQNEVFAVPAFILGGNRLDAVDGIGVSKESLAEFLNKAVKEY